MDFILEYILSDARGFLWLHPFVLGAWDRHFPWPRVGNAYTFAGSPWACLTGVLGVCHGSMREAGGVDGW
jgi:hypothetical protein